jgi:class 3 adenylate cyclase
MAAAQRLSNEHAITFAIRSGCNEGPCFIVRANDRIDLFGSTINLAARLSGVASGQQLAMPEALAGSLRSTLASEPCEIEQVTSAIKGLPGQLALSVVTYKSNQAPSRLARYKTDPIGIPRIEK